MQPGSLNLIAVPEVRVRVSLSLFRLCHPALAACRSTKETLERTCSLAQRIWCDNSEIRSQKISLEMGFLIRSYHNPMSII